MSTAQVVKFPRRHAKEMMCSECGAKGTASCDCGVAYIPAAEAAERKIIRSPEMSDRSIAVELGINNSTVSRARKQVLQNATPAQTRIGRDGKYYPAIGKKQKPFSVPDPTAEEERQNFIHRATQATEMVHFRPFRLFRTDYTTLANAAEQVAQEWTKAAKELRRLHAKSKHR